MKLVVEALLIVYLVPEEKKTSIYARLSPLATWGLPSWILQLPLRS
jgi:hypothetical protein